MSNTVFVGRQHLSISALADLEKCGEYYFQTRVLKRRMPPGPALIVGGITHALIAQALNTKIVGLDLPNLDAMTRRAADLIGEKFQTDIALVDDDALLGKSAVKERSLEEVVALIEVCLPQLEMIRPARMQDGRPGVEWRWALELIGTDWDLVGYVDLVEDVECGGKTERRIRDWKTASRAPAQGLAAKSGQLALYGLALHVHEGAPPATLRIDSLIKTQKRQGARVVSDETPYDPNHAEATLAKFERAIEVVQRGAFMPNTDGWFCSASYCAFARNGSCPFFRGRKLVQVVLPKKGDSPIKMEEES